MSDEELKRREQTLALIGSLTVALATMPLTVTQRRNVERDQDELIERVTRMFDEPGESAA